MQTEKIIEQRTIATRPADRQPYYTVTRVIYFAVEIIELLLLVRFILRLVGASTAAIFTQAIYNMTNPLVAPFRGVFPTNFGVPTVEWATLLAMIVWAIAGYLLVRLLHVTASEHNHHERM